MTPLHTLIIEKIRQAGGKIPFSTYMEMALYTPQLGYYMREAHPFGQQGDFMTAPEFSPLFGQSLIRAIDPVLMAFSSPVILEFGAGTGKLAYTLLSHCKNIQHYWIVEISPVLRKQQEKMLASYLSKITWFEQCPQEKIEGVVLANEVIDAFPATRFCLQDQTVYEYYVTEKNNTFAWQLDVPSQSAITDFVNNLEIASPYCSELHLSLKPWFNMLSRCLQTGMVLCVDYGFPRHEFYHPDRHEGTLMCHAQHRLHTDPLYLPGTQDITAHVDFTAVAEGASEAGFDVLGYTSQAAFLLECGISELIRTQKERNAVKMLTLPSEMGELFKVIALSKNWHLPVCGFTLQDRRSRL